MITLKKKPYKWMSAHRACQFTFDYQAIPFVFSSIATDDGNKVELFINAPFSDTVSVGDLIYLDAALIGYHVVKQMINAQIFVLETDFVNVPIPQGNAKLITPVQFSIYSGYSSGSLAPYNPYEIVATFLPEPNPQGQLVFDISGYVNSLFDVIDSNDYATINAKKVYYNLFNQVTLVTSAGTVSVHNALNASIDMFTLNELYVDTGLSLDSGILGNHYFSCGTYESMAIVGDLVTDDEKYVEIVHINGTGFGNIAPAPTDWNNDYNPPPPPGHG